MLVNFLLSLSVLLGLAAVALAALAWRRCEVPPQQRIVSDVMLQVGDLRYDVDALLASRHKLARRENVEKAREVATVQRATAKELAEEAAAVLARSQQQPQLELVQPAASDDLGYWRKRAGIV